MITVRDIANMREDERTCDVITMKDVVNICKDERTRDELRNSGDDSVFVTFKEPFLMMLGLTHVDSCIWRTTQKNFIDSGNVIVLNCDDYGHIIVVAAKDEFDLSDLTLFMHAVMQKIAICADNRSVGLTGPSFWRQYITLFLEYSKVVFEGGQVGYGGYRS